MPRSEDTMKHARPSLWLGSLLAIAGLIAATPRPASAEGDPPAVAGARVIEAYPGLTFETPLGLVPGPQGSDDLYVLEQVGRVKRIAKPRGQTPAPQPAVFLDITAKVFPRMQGGLLGMAFHPAAAQNGRFFVDYVRQAASGGFEIVVAEFHATGGAADPASEKDLLVIPKTTAVHNAGCLAFGPHGMLYISTGDNGNQKEAATLTSQNPTSLLGKFLRIDVDHPQPGLAYGIPSDNPWATANGVRREIWAYGFRNPWRFSFDAQGTLWTTEPGSKGEGCHEWVVKVERGKNHGWPYMEGSRPLEPMPQNVSAASFAKSFFDWVRGPDPDVTAGWGGYVYRGSRVPALQGKYLFGDYARGSVYVIDVASGQAKDWRTLAKVAGACSMGEDNQGELYVVSLDQGKVFLVAPAS